MPCPECGNKEVVTKADAWDALNSYPPKAQREIDCMTKVLHMAQELTVNSPALGDTNTVVMTVQADDLENLKEAIRSFYQAGCE